MKNESLRTQNDSLEFDDAVNLKYEIEHGYKRTHCHTILHLVVVVFTLHFINKIVLMKIQGKRKAFVSFTQDAHRTKKKKKTKGRKKKKKRHRNMYTPYEPICDKLESKST